MCSRVYLTKNIPILPNDNEIDYNTLKSALVESYLRPVNSVVRYSFVCLSIGYYGDSL